MYLNWKEAISPSPQFKVNMMHSISCSSSSSSFPRGNSFRQLSSSRVFSFGRTSWMETFMLSNASLKFKEKYIALKNAQECHIKGFIKQNNWGTNKWRFYKKTSNIHHQISLISMNSFYFYNICYTFCDQLFKNEVLIAICTELCRILKWVHRSAYML